MNFTDAIKDYVTSDNAKLWEIFGSFDKDSQAYFLNELIIKTGFSPSMLRTMYLEQKFQRILNGEPK